MELQSSLEPDCRTVNTWVAKDDNVNGFGYYVGQESSREENKMSKIAILYCKRIKDHSCVACAKCFKGIAENNAEFARHEVVDLVAMTDCGDCPGLVIPRANLITDVAEKMDRPIDTIHLGTCIKLAMDTSECPIDYGELKFLLEQRYGVEVVLGTHAY